MFIAGMHRSGTSATASMAVKLGLEQSPDVLPAHLFNPGGHFESVELFQANEAILDTLGHKWDIPPQGGLDENDIHRIRDCGLLTKLRQQFQEKSTNRNWCDKDPRLAITLPVWDQVLLRKVPVVACIRNPSEVAISLRLREGIPLEYGVMLWRYYNQSLRQSCLGRATILIDYDLDLKNKTAETAAKILSFAEQQGYTVKKSGIDQAIATFQAKYQRNQASEKEDIPGEISRRLEHAMRVYHEIRERPLSEWPAQLETSQQLHEEDAQWLTLYSKAAGREQNFNQQSRLQPARHDEISIKHQSEHGCNPIKTHDQIEARWKRLIRDPAGVLGRKMRDLTRTSQIQV